MGHLRLGELPRTRKWNEVVELVKSEADIDTVAAAALDAAEKGLRKAADDEALNQATWLLTQLPLAARDPKYIERLAELGITVGAAPQVVELVAAFSDAIDAHVRHEGGRSDLGEMAQMAAAEALTAVLSPRSRSLFGTSPEDVRRELGALATPKQFGLLARDFFARLMRRYLGFYLSRELSNHVGGGRRFENINAHSEFDKALDLHCRQAARIVEEFSGSWFSKTDFEGGITPEKARRFGHVAFKKLRAELLRGGETE
jgi:hypothetical protein